MVKEIKNRKLYWALIGTFSLLYLAVAFVSTLHAITFFQLANTLGLAILLGAAYEIGQASVLFSILMTENKNRLLAWGMMFLLTALQVTANVYASFKFMDGSGSNDWTYWQRSILFGVEADDPEMYKVIISWISGALLPLVALGMTALVADNIRLARGESETEEEIKGDNFEEIVENEVQKRLEEEKEKNEPLFKNPFKKKKKEDKEKEDDSQEKIKARMEALSKAQKEFEEGKSPKLKTETTVLREPKTLDLQDKPENLLLEFLDDEKTKEKVKEERDINKGEAKEIEDEFSEMLDLQDAMDSDEKDGSKLAEKEVVSDQKPEISKVEDKKPVNKQSGWHFMNEFVDDEYNVFHKGKYIENDPSKTPTSKKA